MILHSDLKLGISEKSIFHEFHPDAEDLFNVTCDLKLVCEKLRDRSQRHKRQVSFPILWEAAGNSVIVPSEIDIDLSFIKTGRQKFTSINHIQKARCNLDWMNWLDRIIKKKWNRQSRLMHIKSETSHPRKQ